LARVQQAHHEYHKAINADPFSTKKLKNNVNDVENVLQTHLDYARGNLLECQDMLQGLQNLDGTADQRRNLQQRAITIMQADVVPILTELTAIYTNNVFHDMFPQEQEVENLGKKDDNDTKESSGTWKKTEKLYRDLRAGLEKAKEQYEQNLGLGALDEYFIANDQSTSLIENAEGKLEECETKMINLGSSSDTRQDRYHLYQEAITIIREQLLPGYNEFNCHSLIRRRDSLAPLDE
jgi:hypothetical protein